MPETTNYGFDSTPEITELHGHTPTSFKSPDFSEKTIQQCQLSDKEKEKEKRSLYWSMAGLCLCITGVASAFDALFNSQTSLLPINNLGNTSITIGSGMTIVASALTTSYFIQLCGIKKAMILSMFFISIYFAAYFYPELVVIVIFSVVSGFGFSCMLTSWYAYGNSAAYWHHHLFGGDLNLTLTLMTSVINMFGNGGYLWGNLLLYLILDDDQVTSNSTETNVTICGVNYCNEDLYNSTNAKPPPEVKYYTLIGVFTGISLAGTIGAIFIADIPKKLQSGQSTTKKNFKDFLKVLLESWHVLKQPKGFLSSFLILFIGMEQAFTASVFTQAFITCNVGVSKVGFIMFTYGISEIVMSGAQWLLIKTLGRPLLLMVIYGLFTGCYIFLLTSESFHEIAYFIVATLFGMGDATLLSNTFALYGFLFPEHTEGAFSLITLWMGIGTFVPFLANQHLCVSTKLYILIGFGTFAFGVYLILEVMLRLQARRKTS